MLEQFAEDATYSPHVNGLSVALGPKQHFWGSVPQGSDCGGQSHIFWPESPGQAKVAKLELSAVGVQQVARLQVAVHGPPAVQVIHRSQQLQQQALHLALAERHRHPVHQP
eukprot:CAMPEP_0119154756 /NCGR_PEP_ID=MMETSP1310-20130426/51243_1 /TAXON_ID=464262 /ORGANISM="Genus nov. species nov., Strain RCC2339" /LENGTH=110 /DNA_ID=CAMNT_0007147315 /DNA_START=369 /DNA_END=701 /DNA_ORIENTATION=+